MIAVATSAIGCGIFPSSDQFLSWSFVVVVVVVLVIVDVVVVVVVVVVSVVVDVVVVVVVVEVSQTLWSGVEHRTAPLAHWWVPGMNWKHTVPAHKTRSMHTLRM